MTGVRRALLIGLLALSGCQSPSERAIRFAERSGLAASDVQGELFRHQLFTASGLPTDTLYVFIDGDGTPWTHGGFEVSSDPTPRRALALQLAAATPHAVLYLGRPCYFQIHADLACSAEFWTAGRYSAVVIASMAAVVNRFVARLNHPRLVLIGYSGGGALAVLMAPQIPATRAVVTIAANLDSDAWTLWHGYLPLTGSLNAALQAPLATSIQQLHLVGGLDSNVPETLNLAYLGTLSEDQIWHFPQFDHLCCWVQNWSSILPRIDSMLTAGG